MLSLDVLAVALTVTPAMSLLLLPRSSARAHEAPLVRLLKACYARVLPWILARPRASLALLLGSLTATAVSIPALGEEFLPAFRERDFLMHWVEKPGTSIEAMQRITERASRELRPGDAWKNAALLPEGEKLTPKDWGPGTVHVDAVDAKGNMASFTPSGAWISSAEVIEPLGFPLSVRMMTFYLAPAHHPNVVAPGKRPRTTLTPSMAFRNGKPWMAFGTMGGDNQGQWLLQFTLCRAAYGMSIPEAIEAPRLSSEHTPGFFAPHASAPNRVRIEPRFGAGVLDELRRRGHDLDVAPDWSEGFVSCAAYDEDTGLIEAGCDPRGSKSECFPATAIAW